MVHRAKPLRDERDIKRVVESQRQSVANVASRLSLLETVSSGRRFLYVSSRGVAINQSTTETDIASVVLNGGLLGETNVLEIVSFLNVVNLSSTTRTSTPRIYFGSRVLSLGPVNIATTANGLFQLRAFIVGAGDTMIQSAFGTIYLSQSYGTFNSVNVLEGANGLQFDVNTDEDQLLRLTIQHNTTDPLLTTTSLVTMFGYPIPASG